MNHQMQQLLQNPRIGLNRSGAIAIWLIGAYMTAGFLAQVGVVAPMNFVFGAILQMLLTKAQSPIWRPTIPPIPLRTRLRLFKGATASLVIDAVLNMAGIWPYINNLGNSTVWSMLSEMTASDNAPTVATKGILAFILAVLTAGGSEVLWEQED